MTAASVVVVVVAKDEEAIIGRALRSARAVASSWLLVDTGSTDETVTEAANAMAGIRGQVCPIAWEGFGAARTTALRLAASWADYALMVDADQEIVGDLPFSLTADAYNVRTTEAGTSWRVPRLTRCGPPWRYVGRTHEYLTCDDPWDAADLDGLQIVHHADGSSRPNKYERDRELLEADLAENPTDRTIFYLAQTVRDLGDTDSARQLYLRRAAMKGWEEERWFAQYSAAVLGSDDRELLEAFAARPTRPEPLYWLARRARLAGHFENAHAYAVAGLELAPSGDSLFVADWITEWGLAGERDAAADSMASNRGQADAGTVNEPPRGETMGFRGMWQIGAETARVTLTGEDGELLFEDVVAADRVGGYEPPEKFAEEWTTAEWEVETEGTEPNVRKVITCFVVELGLDGNVILRPDISARYDMLRPASPSDMLTCLGRCLEEVRADLVSHLVTMQLADQMADQVGLGGMVTGRVVDDGAPRPSGRRL